MATDPHYQSVQPEFRQMPERRILYAIGRTEEFGTFPDACRGAIGALFAHIAAHNIAFEPGTFSGLCPFDAAATGELPPWYQASVNIGVDADPPVSDKVQTGVLEGGRELVGVHVGPYAGLIQSWELLNEFRKEMGEEIRGGVNYDVYVDDPQTVDEAQMRTEMHFPLV